jgi:hypothetical protein
MRYPQSTIAALSSGTLETYHTVAYWLLPRTTLAPLGFADICLFMFYFHGWIAYMLYPSVALVLPGCIRLHEGSVAPLSSSGRWLCKTVNVGCVKQ